MSRVPERIYIRKYCKVPVQYTDFYSGALSQATMHNCSVDGMYLELDDSILPGTEIKIKVKKRQSHAYRLQEYKDYKVKVVWCRKKGTSGRPLFGVGTKKVMNDTAMQDNEVFPDEDWNTNYI